MTDHLVHSLDALRINEHGLTDCLILKNLAALLIESILDIAGDVDLVYTQLNGFCDLVIGISGTTVKNKF